MASRLDSQARNTLEQEHVRFDSRIRDLLLRPATPSAWAREVDELANDITHHLDAEEAVLAPLEGAGDEGERAAAALRSNHARIRRDLEQLRGRHTVDAARLLLLSYDLTDHAPRAQEALEDCDMADSLPKPHPVAAETAGVFSGAVVGATMGIVAGPVGIIGGAVAGGIAAGIAMAAVHDGDEADRRHDEELDRAIGVDGGHIGEASPNAPPARIGAFSTAASGAGGGSGGADNDDAAGPLSAPVDGR